MTDQTSPLDTDSPISKTSVSDNKRQSGRNLPLAIGIGAGLIGYIVASVFWFQWGFVVLVTLALCLGSYEVARAVRHNGAKPAMIPIFIGVLAMTLAPYMSRLFVDNSTNSLIVLTGSFAVSIMLCLLWRLGGQIEGYIRDISASVFVLCYVGLLGSSATLMLAESNGAWRIIAFILVNTANDTGAFAIGSSFGKHKAFPKISPNKTWEGLLGGLFFTLVCGIAVMMWMFSAPLWTGLVFGMVIFALGTTGDLIESIIKRDSGIKDMSGFLPGHGGVMDRIDSLLVAAPGAWLVLHLTVS